MKLTTDQLSAGVRAMLRGQPLPNQETPFDPKREPSESLDVWEARLKANHERGHAAIDPKAEVKNMTPLEFKAALRNRFGVNI